MKSLITTSFLALSLTIGCGGGEKKTETPQGGTDTATPVTTNGGDGDATPTDGAAPVAAVDPAVLEKGAAVFGEYCSTCHGDDGSGSGKSPAVKGAEALGAFADDAALLEYTKKEMPKDDPGSLSDEDYKAVVAWMRN